MRKFLLLFCMLYGGVAAAQEFSDSVMVYSMLLPLVVKLLMNVSLNMGDYMSIYGTIKYIFIF